MQGEVNTEVEIRNKARQKQLEINRQKKLDEKKKVKKEKQKVKKDTSEKVIKNNIEKINKKEPKKIKTSQKKKQSFSLGKLLFWFIMILFLIVWILISIQHPWTLSLTNILNSCFDYLLNRMPPEYKPYGVNCINTVKVFQDYTRNITLNTIEFVNTNKNIQELLKLIKESYYKLTEASVASK